MSTLLRIRGITKAFPGTLALNDVSLEFNAGEVHALMGENGAGKSTLLNILTGSLRSDQGEILINDRLVSFRSSLEVRKGGISIVHQELGLFPELSVAENILVGQTPSRFGLLDRKRMLHIAQELLSQFQVEFGLNTLVRDLSVSQQQIVEIAKALALDAHTYIFDEPTSTLSGDDVERLFQVIRGLRKKQKAIIYVSHKFSEIFQISDRISILRDGQLVGTGLASEMDTEGIIKAMVGRTLDRIYPEKGKPGDEVLLEVSHLSAGTKCMDISFKLFRGEILGIFGLVGSGRTEIVRALTGVDRKQSGQIRLDDKEVNIRTVRDSIDLGMYYLTEDRKKQGLFLKLAIGDNVAVTHLGNIASLGMIRKQKVEEVSTGVLRDLRVKASSVSQQVGSLSGGNQQKVMVGKWLSKAPKIVILDEPTRGIDVGAKAEIHQLLRRLANEGIGVIMISSELPEIVGLSDRVMVVHKGHFTGELTGPDVNDETIMTLASGLDAHAERGVGIE
ncbi:Putative ABC transporter [Acididesulfobacillus acetoxydans]|uniref:ABC transporter n=1 Tax=Acididesulfobacillus acetoxydans TaxID=1561005 RepID=A0A8S0XB56_9FIRM|nr:sugar ABC transporter ATP-binding protein [Acididesulfobacillus acetoxydans]CAA7600796.1 Putative ABC transporter [Acididesulfobacillus acetoxydans]CEJ08644.1 Ribose import ATP-binding protein RbsA [Acididesulfobacillus acetoxydans]